MNYSQLCSKIADIDPNVRLVVVYNKNVEKLAEVIKKNTSMHVPEKITKEAVGQALIRWDSRTRMKEWIGPAKFAMAEYAKVKRFTFYLNDSDLLLISTETEMDNNLLISKVLEFSKNLKP